MFILISPSLSLFLKATFEMFSLENKIINVRICLQRDKNLHFELFALEILLFGLDLKAL